VFKNKANPYFVYRAGIVDFQYNKIRKVAIKECPFYPESDKKVYMNNLWFSNTFCLENFYESLQGGWTS